MAPSPEETLLIHRVQAGGPDGRRAFEILVAQHEAWLLRYLRHLVQNRQLAEDLAQTVLLSAYTGIAGFRGDASFKTWLRTAAGRAAVRALKANRYDLPGDLPDSEVTQPDNSDEVGAVTRTLASVPLPYREVLILRHLEELTIRQIAVQLDISQSAAKMRLSRARESFRESYGRHAGNEA